MQDDPSDDLADTAAASPAWPWMTAVGIAYVALGVYLLRFLQKKNAVPLDAKKREAMPLFAIIGLVVAAAADCRKQRQRLSGGCKLLPRVGQHAAQRRPGEFLPNDKLLRLSARVCLHHGLERGADAGSAPVRGGGAQAHPDGVRFGGGGTYLPHCAQEERQCQSGGHFDAADGVQPRRFPQQCGLVPD